MLVSIAKKQKDKGDKYIYFGLWLNHDDKLKNFWFRFSMVEDDNTKRVDFNKLSGNEGTMQIKTKSVLDFKPEDIIVFNKQKYTIVMVDGNRKEDGEQAYLRMRVNGNTAVYLTLRKAG